MARPLAVITGASSGIGQELARVFAGNGFDLVISARREARLETLAEELSAVAKVDIVAADLAKARGPARLLAEIESLGRPVDVLVNNAGVAASGPFQALSHAQVNAIVQLNVRALTELTYGVLPQMLERSSGRILNVASVASFQPVPGLSLYGASKAFVLSFTESLSEDVKGTGVTVTALCPGPTRTEMVADIKQMELAGPFLSDARQVAQEGYRACMNGEVIRVPGLMNQAMVAWSQYQPRWLVRFFSGLAARSSFNSVKMARSQSNAEG